MINVVAEDCCDYSYRTQGCGSYPQCCKNQQLKRKAVIGKRDACEWQRKKDSQFDGRCRKMWVKCEMNTRWPFWSVRKISCLPWIYPWALPMWGKCSTTELIKIEMSWCWPWRLQVGNLDRTNLMGKEGKCWQGRQKRVQLSWAW